MAKKKNVIKRWKERYFGKDFGFWDVVLLIMIIGAGWFIYDTQGVEGFWNEIASAVFYAVVVSFIVNRIIQKAKRN